MKWKKRGRKVSDLLMRSLGKKKGADINYHCPPRASSDKYFG
jgi:hypothetical protein